MENLKKSEELFAAIFEGSSSQMIVTDREARIIAVNKAKRESGDRPPNIGEVMYVDYAAEHENDMHAVLMACMSSGERIVFPEQLYGDKILSITISPILDGAIIISEDVTARKMMEKALKKSEALMIVIVESARDAIVLINSEGNITLWNQSAERILGYTCEEVLGKNMHMLMIPERHHKAHCKVFDRFIKTGHGSVVNKTTHQNVRHKNGTMINVQISISPINIDGMWCALGILRDTTEQNKLENDLRDAEWKFRALFEKGPIGVAYHQMMYDDNGNPVDYRFIDANCAYIELTGVDPRNKTVREAFPGIENDSFDWIGTYAHVASTGEKKHFEQFLHTNDHWYEVVAYQYKLGHFVTAFIDITGRKKMETELRKSEERYRVLSMTDSLTGLFNRWHFQFELEKEMNRSRRYKQYLSAIMFDIDDFKKFNDEHGHEAGDRVLELVGSVVKKSVRMDDIPCRFGGEEFFIILPMTTQDVARAIAFRISVDLKNLQLNFTDKGISVSCGVVQYDQLEDVDAFVRRVDSLMLFAKRNGKDRICL